MLIQLIFNVESDSDFKSTSQISNLYSDKVRAGYISQGIRWVSTIGFDYD